MAEAWRNLTAVGARPLAVTDNLNFGNPERPEIMGQLVGCIDGIAEACRALDFPVVSGNVSLYNETNGRAILPTPDHRRRRPDRRFHQVGDARLQGGGRGDPAHRRDRGLARPVALSARDLRARRRRAAAGRSRGRAQERRSRARADRRGCRHRGSRRLRRRASGCARRDGDGVRHRRRARPSLRFRLMPSGSARTRRATSSPSPREWPRRCWRAPAPPASRRGSSA